MGWEPAAFSEIEPFPSAVLAHHYPAVPNVGDMTKYREWNLGTIDLLVGGTPCQSFSVAGLRKGLDDPRGNLALVYCGILDHFRPRWFVWENVPGVLSSAGGRDFGSFLGALAQLGYGFSYRVLDAQWFGVAQRRRRVFVVGHLGDWRRAAAVLFERSSLRRHPQPSREEGERIAPSISTGAPFSRTGNERVECDALVTARMAGFGDYVADGTASTCKARDYKDATDLVAQPIPLNSMTFGRENEKTTRQCLGVGNPGDPVPTLSKAHSHAVAKPVVYDTTNITSPANGSNPKPGDPCFTLAKGQHPPLLTSMAVRRLTPTECERLQGFPDDYTQIAWRKSPISNCPDGPRYKALGNSMAVPVMRWIGNRINKVDGIGR